MDTRQTDHYRQGYVGANADTKILPHNVIQTMYEAIATILDRNTGHPNELDYQRGRFDAYSVYFMRRNLES